MSDRQDLQPALRKEAQSILCRLSSRERESLLIKNWVSHDARWFMAAAQEYGMDVANHLNGIAAHNVGVVEAHRAIRALRLPPVNDLDDFLLIQEVLICIFGPELMDYEVEKYNAAAYRLCVARCFAHENTTRAGVADQYNCGVVARITGWLEAMGLSYQLNPPLGACLKAQGSECVYEIEIGEAIYSQ
ncbi:MAG: DUF6125 family protein [Anaerolineae bacterium]|nr:DUF6125 family protein [Anaerolineae bacterium]